MSAEHSSSNPNQSKSPRPATFKAAWLAIKGFLGNDSSELNTPNSELHEDVVQKMFNKDLAKLNKFTDAFAHKSAPTAWTTENGGEIYREYYVIGPIWQYTRPTQEGGIKKTTIQHNLSRSTYAYTISERREDGDWSELHRIEGRTESSHEGVAYSKLQQDLAELLELMDSPKSLESRAQIDLGYLELTPIDL